ncbi:hypothetical protein Tsubulata_016864, partial [Turnera subulata]
MEPTAGMEPTVGIEPIAGYHKLHSMTKSYLYMMGPKATDKGLHNLQ